MQVKQVKRGAKNRARVQNVEKDPVAEGRKNGFTVIDNRNKEGAEPARPIDRWAEWLAHIEGEVRNGGVTKLLEFLKKAQENGFNPAKYISEARQQELIAFAAARAKRIRELDALATQLPAARAEAMTLNNPTPVRTILAQFRVTEEEMNSSKIRKIVAAAEKALEGFSL